MGHSKREFVPGTIIGFIPAGLRNGLSSHAETSAASGRANQTMITEIQNFFIMVTQSEEPAHV
jgi:hypothetical protein